MKPHISNAVYSAGQSSGDVGSPLSMLLTWYVENICKLKEQVPPHVLSVLNNHLLDAPWSEFVPSLKDLENFNLVCICDSKVCTFRLSGCKLVEKYDASLFLTFLP